MLTARGAGVEVFVVDDEPAVLDTLSVVLGVHGHRVRTFPDGASFLKAVTAQTPECILLDVRMPGRSGLDVLKELNSQYYPAPILIISGAADIPMAVEAIRNGAHDVIEKPFDGKRVATRVREAVEEWARRRKESFGSDQIAGSYQLTKRERDVLAQIAAGASNKEAGRQLGISPRTIEVHRARIMAKLGARNVADLVRIVLSWPPARS
jgi:two-component system, LuxR family, response regulator FixJ